MRRFVHSSYGYNPKTKLTYLKGTNIFGEYVEKDIPVELGKLARYLDTDEYKDQYIQDVFPELSPEDRDFILMGITEERWSQMDGDE